MHARVSDDAYGDLVFPVRYSWCIEYIHVHVLTLAASTLKRVRTGIVYFTGEHSIETLQKVRRLVVGDTSDSVSSADFQDEWRWLGEDVSFSFKTAGISPERGIQ